MKITIALSLLMLSGCCGCVAKCAAWDERIRMYEACLADTHCRMNPGNHMSLQKARKNFDRYCKPESEGDSR